MEHNIFAIELCMRLEPGDKLRGQLKGIIEEHPYESTFGAKWKMLQKVSEVLLDHEHLFERGCWDFFDDDGRALRDYEMWSQGMITEEGARKEASGDPGQDGQPRFMTFTLALLVVADSPTSQQLSKLCDIPEDRLWERATFTHILRGLPCVSFASVKSDVIYLIPRDRSWGLTAEDLEDEKFEYLRKIAG